jgi:hypothetical protein
MSHPKIWMTLLADTSTVHHQGMVDFDIHIVDFVHNTPDSDQALQMRLKVESNWIHRLRTPAPMGLNITHFLFFSHSRVSPNLFNQEFEKYDPGPPNPRGARFSVTHLGNPAISVNQTNISHNYHNFEHTRRRCFSARS